MLYWSPYESLLTNPFTSDQDYKKEDQVYKLYMKIRKWEVFKVLLASGNIRPCKHTNVEALFYIYDMTHTWNAVYLYL